MKHSIITSVFLVFVMLSAYAAKQPKPEKITATFIVNIHCHSCKDKITSAMQDEEGIKKLKVDMQAKTVAITFLSNKNTVSNLLEVFKGLGYAATVQEISCIGSKEGCLNATHPVSTMR